MEEFFRIIKLVLNQKIFNTFNQVSQPSQKDISQIVDLITLDFDEEKNKRFKNHFSLIWYRKIDINFSKKKKSIQTLIQ